MLANHAVVLAAILFAWFLVMAELTRFLPVSDAYLALGPENRIVGDLPVGGRILRTANRSVVVSMKDDQIEMKNFTSKIIYISCRKRRIRAS